MNESINNLQKSILDLGQNPNSAQLKGVYEEIQKIMGGGSYDYSKLPEGYNYPLENKEEKPKTPPREGQTADG